MKLPFCSKFDRPPGCQAVVHRAMIVSRRSLSALEAGPFVRRSSDLVWQMLFACAGILVSELYILTTPNSLNSAGRGQ